MRIPATATALIMLFAAACGGGNGEGAGTESSEPEGGTEQASPELITEGQGIFTGQGICYTCHGQNGEGTQLAPNLTDGEWINIEQPVTVDKIIALVRTGVPQPKQHPAPMPPMGGAQLTDDQLTAVANYVYSLSHPA